MIIDKLTYLGSCELLLDPGSISLKTTMDTCTPAVAGIVLERQLDSLNGIVRKEGVRALGMQLLADAKSIYGEDMPVRRARILVKSLDLVYHKEAEPVTGIECPEDIGKEAEMLLTQAVGHDTRPIHCMLILCRTSDLTVILRHSAHSIVRWCTYGSHCIFTVAQMVNRARQ